MNKEELDRIKDTAVINEALRVNAETLIELAALLDKVNGMIQHQAKQTIALTETLKR